MLETLLGKLECSGANGSSRTLILRASVIRFLDHNVPVSVVKTSSSSTANIAQNLTHVER